MEWRIVPDYPDYECCQSDTVGPQVRRKRKLMGTRMGMNTRGSIGGKVLCKDSAGRFALKRSPHHAPRYYSPPDVWAHAFLGAPLYTTLEKRQQMQG